MVSTLDYGSSGPGSIPGRGHCVVFMGKTHCFPEIWQYSTFGCPLKMLLDVGFGQISPVVQ